MAYIVADRVKQKTTTAGSGTITLGSSVTGFQTFSSVCSNGDTFHYAVVHLTDGTWETGIGTYASSGGTVARSVLTSSSSNSLVSFATGDKEIFITPVSSNLIYKTDQGAVGGSVIKLAVIDFGSTPTSGGTYTITDAGALTSNRFVVTASPSTTNSAQGGDELECDGFTASAYCLTNGTITVEIIARPGPVIGKRNFNYIIS
jgi:hypothetical protein